MATACIATHKTRMVTQVCVWKIGGLTASAVSAGNVLHWQAMVSIIPVHRHTNRSNEYLLRHRKGIEGQQEAGDGEVVQPV